MRLLVLAEWASQSGRATQIRRTRTDENGCKRPFIATSAKTTKAVGGWEGGGDVCPYKIIQRMFLFLVYLRVDTVTAIQLSCCWYVATKYRQF